jgi:hypothetical protein
LRGLDVPPDGYGRQAERLHGVSGDQGGGNRRPRWRNRFEAVARV